MKSVFREKLLADLKKPIVKQNAVRYSAKAARSAGPDQRRGILVVDDDLSMIELATLVLEDNGFRTYWATSVKDGLRFLQSSVEISLVLCDINMPDGLGLILLDRIKQSLRLSRVLVIMVTGCGDKETVIKALQKGANGYIRKPCTGEQILAKVQEALATELRNILIVSEDRLISTIISRDLHSDTRKSLIASSGEQALAILSQIPVHVIVSELALVDMTGFDLMVQAAEKYGPIPTLFLADKPLLAVTEEEVIGAGGQGLIRRPFNNTQVCRKIDSLLSGSRDGQ